MTHHKRVSALSPFYQQSLVWCCYSLSRAPKKSTAT